MKEQRDSFGRVAEDYLRARPEYPSKMFRHIFEAASIDANSRVLEIGCGSGQATTDFARQGCHLVAIDPAKSALELLAERCSRYRKVELFQSSFENFESDSRFDLIFFAQAFHWLDPRTVSKKLVRLLKPGGHVMLSWHLQDVVPETPQAELYLLSSKYFKSFPVMNPPEYGREFVDAMAQILGQSGHFEKSSILEYPWRQSYNSEMFKALFRSASCFEQLDEPLKLQVQDKLTKYLDGLPDDPIVNYRTCLIEAQLGDALTPLNWG